MVGRARDSRARGRRGRSGGSRQTRERPGARDGRTEPRYRARHGRRRRVVTQRSGRGSPPRRALERRRRSDRGRVLRRRIRHSRRGVRADTRRDLTGPPRGQRERETRRGRGGRRTEIRRPVTARPVTARPVTAHSPPPARRRGRGRPRRLLGHPRVLPRHRRRRGGGFREGDANDASRGYGG